MNIFHVSFSDITISKCTFLNNTGSYSMFEEIHNLPFYEILTLRKNKLNYIDVLEKNNETCTV